MRAKNSFLLASAAAMLVAVPAAAQQSVASADTPSSAATDTVSKPVTTDSKRASLLRKIEIANIRPNDQRGVNMFEAPKTAMPFEGFKLSLGAAFTQQMQGLDHANTADSIPTSTTNLVNANRLVEIGTGFNNATANLYVDAQLAPGIRVALSTYLSSRHHNETWVKDGYLLVDASPIDVQLLNDIMKYVTLRLGHMEVNYGDAHFRRTDNGQAMFNPFVGNLLLDAFTTEIGGEVYVRAGSFLGMVGMTGGEIRGNTARPVDRDPSILGKLGFDRQLDENLRVRLTGSGYYTASSASNTLYAGDRAGSRYYNVLENSQSSESANFRSGMINPGYGDQLLAVMINPFVKYQGLEVFGVIEQAEGRAANETADRKWNQYAADVIYRFGAGEQAYLGGRYNMAEGELRFGTSNLEVSANRWAVGGGWFLTPSVLLKAEYVDQKYNDFPTTDIRNGGKFNGFMVEGVVAF